LSIFDVGGASVVKALVDFVDGGYRTVPGAVPTACTFLRINVTRAIGEGHLEVTCVPLQTLDVTVGNQIDV
jgi:hypothetical protein